MTILNIAGYKFISLSELSVLRQTLLDQCLTYAIKGTVLLSAEGINVTLAGTVSAISEFQNFLNLHPNLNDIEFHKTYSDTQPFRYLKIKLKKEIITLRQPNIDVAEVRAPSLTPELLKQWLDEKRDITLLDTRNNYEIHLGTFNGAINLHLSHFTDFPTAIQDIPHEKPIVMFCTGGIRCEKAALHMKNKGFKEVYQLDGGILGYLARVGEVHYSGDCFVFDERVTVNADSFA